MTKNFKDCLIEFDKAQQNLNKSKTNFILDVRNFMRDKGVPVKVLFFGILKFRLILHKFKE